MTEIKALQRIAVKDLYNSVRVVYSQNEVHNSWQDLIQFSASIIPLTCTN